MRTAKQSNGRRIEFESTTIGPTVAASRHTTITRKKSTTVNHCNMLILFNYYMLRTINGLVFRHSVQKIYGYDASESYSVEGPIETHI